MEINNPWPLPSQTHGKRMSGKFLLTNKHPQDFCDLKHQPFYLAQYSCTSTPWAEISLVFLWHWLDSFMHLQTVDRLAGVQLIQDGLSLGVLFLFHMVSHPQQTSLGLFSYWRQDSKRKNGNVQVSWRPRLRTGIMSLLLRPVDSNCKWVQIQEMEEQTHLLMGKLATSYWKGYETGKE